MSGEDRPGAGAETSCIKERLFPRNVNGLFYSYARKSLNCVNSREQVGTCHGATSADRFEDGFVVAQRAPSHVSHMVAHDRIVNPSSKKGVGKSDSS